MRNSLAQLGEAMATAMASPAAANSRRFVKRADMFSLPVGLVLIGAKYGGSAPWRKASERLYSDDARIGLGDHGVAQRTAERGHVDLEAGADARLDAFRRTQDCGAEVVGGGIAGSPEHRIAEVIVFEVADRVRHVGLAAQKLSLPQDLVAAHDARVAAHVLRKFAEQELRTQGALPQFRVCQIE